jgi:hypothetical protein
VEDADAILRAAEEILDCLHAGSLQIPGIANAPTAAEAINFSTQSAAPVPEPGTWGAASNLFPLSGRQCATGR